MPAPKPAPVQFCPPDSLLTRLLGLPAPKVTREDRKSFVPAEGTVPPPDGRVHSFSSQYYGTDIEKIDRLRAYVRHRLGMDISGAAILRTVLRALDETDGNTVSRVLNQAERDYWADPRRNPRPDDPRHRNKGRQPLTRPLPPAPKKKAKGKKSAPEPKSKGAKRKK